MKLGTGYAYYHRDDLRISADISQSRVYRSERKTVMFAAGLRRMCEIYRLRKVDV